MPLVGSVAAGQATTAGTLDVPSIAWTAIERVGVFAVGASASTSIVAVVRCVIPCSSPTIVIFVGPLIAPAGTWTGTVVVAAPNPYVLAGPAVAPPGRLIADKRTRSKDVSVRPTVTGTSAVPPAAGTYSGVADATLKSPRGPSRDTSSSRSCTGSGSVHVFQSVLPRYC